MFKRVVFAVACVPVISYASPAYVACTPKLHGIWGQGVCLQARSNIKARRKPVTLQTLKAEIEFINRADELEFQEKIGKEFLQKKTI